ncbi:hypothetical protein [Haloarchaeobius sp. HME9146]|uniref:DUF7504 family protein n=1 Tax=Haloarchaeobius sp. HME9146 TaxID=2978732 RepID=UPI0021C0A0B5|nr:hypothetical protein [Haloarchaeobius sp. HME9146]MCT9094657.1 hypothetical protein [Haloarchaeobius sp. HME9146]
MTGIETIGETGNVLLTDREHEQEYCGDLLDASATDTRAELTVSFPKAQTEKTGFGSLSSSQPAKKGVISVGDVMRSAASSSPDFSAPVPMDAVEDPGNLQAIGTSISRFCEQWDRQAFDIVVCFDSLTELLEHASTEAVFQFCHVLNSRLGSVDALAHFHLDPDAHDDETVATFQSIFDETVGETTDADVIEEFAQATDDDIAALTDGWGEEAQYSIVGDGDQDRPDEVTEASDEEIAELLDGC